MQALCVVILAILSAYVIAFAPSKGSRNAPRRLLPVQMGFMDALNKALANDPNLPPARNPGLSKEAEPVLVEFLPSKKQIKAYPGQKISMIAQTAGEKIKYSCKKGDCGTCEVNFNGKIVKACQASLPSVGSAKKYTIGIPSK